MAQEKTVYVTISRKNFLASEIIFVGDTYFSNRWKLRPFRYALRYVKPDVRFDGLSRLGCDTITRYT